MSIIAAAAAAVEYRVMIRSDLGNLVERVDCVQ
jgi:hypothetical protein